MTHFEKYDSLVKKYNLQKPSFKMPSKKYLSTSFAEDKHLNNIPLAYWDNLTYNINYTGLTLAEKVCLLKHIAIYYILKIKK